MYPVCLVSAGVYWAQGQLPLAQAVPYLLGGLVGGMVGGRLYGKVSTLWLRRIFALFLLYGGVQYVR
ncbi:TSUP family transporter [Bengtsoniella intestinalis]|uniref:TSUP family transporter n=1 Tax=Bengtsoniella intestinalis TaxID=3073143 RepID=UPI00391FBADA